VFVCVLYA